LSSGIDYKINESWNLSSYVSMGILNRTKKERSSTAFFNGKPSSDSLLLANNQLDFHYHNVMAGATLNKQWKNGGSWDLSYDTQWFSQGDNQLQKGSMQTQQHTSTPDLLKGNTKGSIHLNAFQMNIKQHFYDQFILRSGIKYTDVGIDSEAQYYKYSASHWEKYSPLTSYFSYFERIGSAYVETQSKWSPKWSSEVGIRKITSQW